MVDPAKHERSEHGMNKRSSQGFVVAGTSVSRRSFVVGLPLIVTGCSGSGRFGGVFGGDYGAVQDGAITVPAVDTFAIDPDLFRHEVAWKGRERPGSIIVRVPERRLYLVQDRGRALRYAVGVARTEAANFRGSAIIGRKEKWPHWTPTARMMEAIPQYRSYASGMDGGLDNPLGARALYLYRDGRDTFFRLHGTNEPESIGHAVSSGCVRLLNQDIIHLYDRVRVGTHVTVLQG
jgi:lipoprotein-anchoring transpeptidase ErfK/SrfK